MMRTSTDLFQFGIDRGEAINKLAEKYLGD